MQEVYSVAVQPVSRILLYNMKNSKNIEAMITFCQTLNVYLLIQDKTTASTTGSLHTSGTGE